MRCGRLLVGHRSRDLERRQECRNKDFHSRVQHRGNAFHFDCVEDEIHSVLKSSETKRNLLLTNSCNFSNVTIDRAYYSISKTKIY